MGKRLSIDSSGDGIDQVASVGKGYTGGYDRWYYISGVGLYQKGIWWFHLKIVVIVNVISCASYIFVL